MPNLFFSSERSLPAQLVLWTTLQLISYWLLMIHWQTPLSISLFVLAHLALFTLWNQKIWQNKQFVILSGWFFLLSVLTWLRASEVVLAVSGFTMLVLNYFLASLVFKDRLPTEHDLVRIPFSWLRTIGWSVSQLRQGIKTLPSPRNLSLRRFTDLLGLALRTTLIALPVVTVFMLLFMAADQEFENIVVRNWKAFLDILWIPNWFNLEKIADFLFETLKFWDVAWYWLYIQGLLIPLFEKQRTWKEYIFKVPHETIFTGVLVIAVFAFFFFVQGTYVPKVFEGFRTQSISPRELIREGFAQLFVVSLLGLALARFARAQERFTQPRWEKTLWLIALVLGAEVLIVSFFASFRLFIYQWFYGFTIARYWGAVVLLQLWAGMLALLAWHFRRLKYQQLIFSLAVSVCAIFFFAGLLNPDRLIIEWRPPTVNKEIDVRYLQNNLSYDSTPFWVEVMRQEIEIARRCEVKIENDQLVWLNPDAAQGEEVRASCDMALDQLRENEKYTAVITSWLARQESMFAYRQGVDPYQGESFYYGSSNYNNRLSELVCERVKKDEYDRGNWRMRKEREAFCTTYLEWQQAREKLQNARELLSQTHSPVAVKVLNLFYIEKSAESEYVLRSKGDELMLALSRASRYRGSGEEAIEFMNVQTLVYRSEPSWVSAGDEGAQKHLSYDVIMEQQQVCAGIREGKYDEVWIWADRKYLAVPFVIRGPYLNAQGTAAVPDTWYKFPECPDVTVTMMAFDLHASTGDHLARMARRMNVVTASYLPQELAAFTEIRFPADTGKTACGVDKYAYQMSLGNWRDGDSDILWVNSDCNDWNPQRTGKVERLDCSAWGCSEDAYYTWWFQRVPNIDNRLTDVSGKPMPNWWFAFGKYDRFKELQAL